MTRILSPPKLLISFLAAGLAVFFSLPSPGGARHSLVGMPYREGTGFEKRSVRAGSIWAGPRLRSPVRVALASRRILLVSDYREKAIIALKRPSLRPVWTLAVPGRPSGIASTKRRLFVGNETTGSVEVYNMAGTWLYDLGGEKGNVQQPTDIAIDSGRGLVFVVDGHDKVIKVFDVAGPLVRTISEPGPELHQLAHPTGIALDKINQQVLVSDYGDPATGLSARVQIYDYTGEHVGAIVGNDVVPQEYRFSRPQGLAVDGRGRIFLVDSLLGQVLVFDRASGTGVKILGSYGSDPGQLLLPLDVVLAARSKDVFVTNNRSGRVEVFSKGGMVP
ncbi:MAG: NHL repeat-containing protein [Acidobacteriota bacterium]